eukprot:gene26654-32208_t
MENRFRRQSQLTHDLNHYLVEVPALFPILEDAGRFAIDTSTRASEATELVYHYGMSENAIALACGTSLLLANCESNASLEPDSSALDSNDFASLQAEIEFEHNLSSITWDNQGSCLAVYDSGGTVHLLKRDGGIAFSKKILPDPELALFLFVTLSPCSEALFSLTKSGLFLCVNNMDTSALCGSGEDKIQALKSLQLLKWTVGDSNKSEPISKASLLRVDSEQGSLKVVLALLDVNGALALKELQADGSCTVNELSCPRELGGKRVVDIRCVLGKACFLLTSEGTLFALSCRVGAAPQVLQAFFIGDSFLSFQFVSSTDSPVGEAQGFLVSVESKSRVYSFTVVDFSDLDVASIIPHGHCPAAQQAQDGVQYLVRPPSANYANNRGLRLRASAQAGMTDVCVQQFSRVSHMLARDIRRSAASVSSFDELHTMVADGRPLPFGMFLGHLVGCAVRSERGVQERGSALDTRKVEVILSRILDQRFAPEILLACLTSLPLLLPTVNICKLFARLQSAVGAQKVAKDGAVESRSVASRLWHYSHLCESALSFEPDKAIESGDCDAPVYEAMVERLHAVLSPRIGYTLLSLLSKDYEHYKDIVLLFQHQLPFIISPSFVLEHEAPAYVSWNSNSLQHLLQKVSISDLFTSVDPRAVVDVPSFLSICGYLLEAYKYDASKQSGEDSVYAASAVVVELCQTLYDFVKIIAGDLSKDNVCKLIIQYALSVLDHLPVYYQPQTLADVRVNFQSLHEHLSLQSTLHKVMKVHVSIEDIQSVGWRGFVFEQLEAFHILAEGGHALCHDMLSAFIDGQLKVLTQKFNVDLDSILCDFIVSTFDQLLSEMATQEDGGQVSPIHEYHTTLAKLLVVYSSISNPAAFGYTCLVKMFAFHSYLHNNETVPLHKAAMVELCAQFCDTTISSIAEEFIVASKGKERDEVSEAFRLYKLRLMARKYAIQDIDLRDNHQLLAALSIITNHSTNSGENAVAAGMHFAVQDGSVRVDIVSAVSRRLVTFASCTSHDDIAYDQKLHCILSCVPSKSVRTVLEDVLDCLRAEHDDLCCQLKAVEKSKLDSAEVRDLRLLADNIAKGIVKLSEAYCDNDYSSHGSTHFLSWRERDVKSKASDPLLHTTNRDMFKVMSSYRRLYHLQTSHQIYILNSDLGSGDTCQAFVRNMVLASVDNLLLSFDQKGQSSAGSAYYSPQQDLLPEFDATFLIGEYLRVEIPRLGKIAHLLGVGLAKVVLTVTRRMVEKSTKALAFMFANNYLDAAKDHSQSQDENENVLAWQDISGNQDESVTFVEEDWQALVDIVRLLTSASMKKSNLGSSYGSSYYDIAATDNTLNELTNAQVLRIHTLSKQTLSKVAVCAPPKVLQKSIELLSMQDLLSSAYSQLEEAKTKQDNAAQTSQKSLLHVEDGVLEHDGLLLSQDQALPLLAQYVVSEMRRRDYFLSASTGKLPSSHDMADLVAFLQRNEKHIMAIKVLYSTWLSSVEVPKLSKMIRASAFPLCHKVLHYRTLDNSFALACLSSLPLEVTVKELKAAVPSTLSTDFYRLQAIATLGEEMATLHDNDSMLLLFQRLTNHAKWWGILSNTLHINVDVKLFQHTDYELQSKYIKSLVTNIVFMSKGNLDMASEYCQVFDIEPEVSLLAYIEYMLTCTISHENWEYKVKQAALGLKETDLVSQLSSILFKLSGTDYERIIYVCQWLISLLSDADDNNHNADVLTKYKNYVDISKYLTNLVIPLNVLEALQKSRLMVEEVTSRTGDHRNHRLSFWSLVNQTLDFIDILCIASVTWTLDKISPLVRYINITMEDFYLCLICGYYPSVRPDSSDKGVETVSSSTCADIIGKVEERMSTYLLLAPQHFIRVYMYINEFEEKSHSLSSFAREMRIFVLKRTVAIMEKAEMEAWVLSRGDGKQEQSYNKSSLVSALLNLEVESIVTAFTQSLSKAPDESRDNWWEKAPYITENGHINLLLIAERLLEICLEACWDEHISHHVLTDICKSTSLFTMLTDHSLSSAALRILATTAKYVLEVVSLSPATAPQSLETIVLTMIYKLLADSSAPHANAQDSHSSGAILKSDSLHHLLPSALENQQADVVFTGFGLFAVLTISQYIFSTGVPTFTIHEIVWSEFSKVAFEDKIGALGFRNIPARRFNARCRCKVTVALAHLIQNQSRGSTPKIKHVDYRIVQRHLSYYCLLASMQETRNITYSEESFYSAFHSYDHTTLRSILLTWIYSEGADSRSDGVSSLIDILSLAVDLYVLASLFEVTSMALFTELLERLVANKGSERLVHRLVTYMCYHQPCAFNQAVYQCAPQVQSVFAKVVLQLFASMNGLADSLSKDLPAVIDNHSIRHTDTGVFSRFAEGTKGTAIQKLLRHADQVMFRPLPSDVPLRSYQIAVTWDSLLSLLAFLSLRSPLGVLSLEGVSLEENLSAALRLYVDTVVVQALKKASRNDSVVHGRQTGTIMSSLTRLLLTSRILAMCAAYQAPLMDSLLLDCWTLASTLHSLSPDASIDFLAQLMDLLAGAISTSPADRKSPVYASVVRALASLPRESAPAFIPAVLQFLLADIVASSDKSQRWENSSAHQRGKVFCTNCLYQMLQDSETPMSTALKDFVMQNLSEAQRKKLWSSLRQ